MPATRKRWRRSKRFAATGSWKRWRTPPQELLRSSDLEVSLQKIADRVGSTAGVDRVHIFLVDTGGDDGLLKEHYLWAAHGLTTSPDFANAPRPMANVGLKTWIPRLKRGEIIQPIVSAISMTKPAAS